MYLRTFKLKLDAYEKFNQAELYKIGAYLDKHEHGIIPLQDIHQALLGGGKFKPFVETLPTIVTCHRPPTPFQG